MGQRRERTDKFRFLPSLVRIKLPRNRWHKRTHASSVHTALCKPCPSFSKGEGRGKWKWQQRRFSRDPGLVVAKRWERIAFHGKVHVHCFLINNLIIFYVLIFVLVLFFVFGRLLLHVYAVTCLCMYIYQNMTSRTPGVTKRYSSLVFIMSEENLSVLHRNS